MYGGDGQNTFGIPDLRGRVAVGSQGNGPGISAVAQGEKAGTNNVTVIGNGSVNITLGLANLPSHTHTATFDPTGLAANTVLTAGNGTNGGLTPQVGGGLTATAGGNSGAAIYLPAATPPANPVALSGINTTLSGTGSISVNPTGNGQPLAAPVQTQSLISVMQPYLGLNYIIAMEGIFPSRN
jgi:microcystin-dependent protein